MKRRDFVAGLMIASAMRPAVAQQPAKTKRIAVVADVAKVSDMRAHPTLRMFLEVLGRVGYVEGQNLVVERYSAEGAARERFAELAREVVGTRPDVVSVFSDPMAVAFKAATTEIPIVAMTGDPVAAGLVQSLAHPGGNITGVSVDAGPGLYGKRVELLSNLVPKSSKLFYLTSQRHWEVYESLGAREAAKRLGISLTPVFLGAFNAAAYESTFKSMEQDRADALLVSSEGAHFANRTVLVGLVAKTRLPAMFSDRRYVELGGLISYGNDIVESFRRFASQIADIFRGAKPQDIPYYQVIKFELVINLKTAKSQGIEVPPTLLSRADEIIE